MAKKTKTKSLDLQAEAMRLARELVAHHVEEDDGEECFNIATYLDDLEQELGDLIWDTDQLDRFSLDAHQTARWLWCCLALAEGESPYGHTFRGMPLLD